jgi:hypothetical protein
VLLEKPGYAELMGRAGQNDNKSCGVNAYYLRASDTGSWSIVRNDLSCTQTTVASGTTAALGTNRWHTLGLGFSGGTITAIIDGTTVSTVSDFTFGAGQAGFSTSQGETAQFDNLNVVPGPGGSTNRVLRGVASARCVDVPAVVQANGTQVQLWDCNGGANQQWTYTSSKQLQVYGSKCLDAEAWGTSPGTHAIIWDCNSGTNQQWNLNADGSVTGVQSGLCLDASGGETANATKIILWTCNGGSNQKWNRS